MKSYKFHIGIDVSKSKLDVFIVINATGKQFQHFIVPNNYKGIQDVLKQVSRLRVELSDVLFCFEHTGVYSMPLCYCLQEKKVDYWMVPAIEIKRAKGLTRGKNDKADARDIAFYAISHQHKTQLSQLPERELIQIKLLLTEREKLVKAITLFKTTSEASDYLPKEVLKETLRVNASTLRMLNKQLKQIEGIIASVVRENETINRQFDIARSVPGVGPQTALYLIVYTRCFKTFDNWRKLACYAGIAPFEYSSGSSIRGKTKVNHLANKKLKSLLNMAALSAKKNDRQLNQYYERKVKEGKNPMLVMNALRCKVISRVFAAINRNTEYVDTLKFAA